jgi:S-adenosylmethionine decarboxylase
MNTHDTDYFSTCLETGDQYAGRHMLADFWGVQNMGDAAFIQKAIEDSALAAEATILYSHYHHFGEGCGVSGVTVLAESHISIHTWPERDFASLDIFMCGDCDPQVALAHLKRVMQPSQVDEQLHRRGIVKAVAAIAA